VDGEMRFDEIIKKHHSDDAGFCRHYLTLYAMVLGIEAKSVFEFGCGFSSKTILQALEKTGGKLITCDTRPIGGTGISKAELGKHMANWRYIQGNSLDVVPNLKNEVFDLVLHDGSHEQEVVEQDLQYIIPKIKKNGVILIHDTLHPGGFKVDFNQCKKVLKDVKHEFVTLPYGYGLTIIKIKEDFGNGEVEIKWRKQS
jgi:predicted O-methyltransferase YrrM